MAELKTQKTDASVEAFFDAIEDERKRADARTVSGMMAEAADDAPALWGSSIVGFGHRRLKYASGREIDWMVVGFAPRKANLTLYLPGGLEPLRPLLERLGPHKTSGGCLYVKRLSDVDLDVLKTIVETAIRSVEPTL